MERRAGQQLEGSNEEGVDGVGERAGGGPRGRKREVAPGRSALFSLQSIIDI